MRAGKSHRRIEAVQGPQAPAVARCPLVRRKRPGPANLTQALEWEVPGDNPVSDAELDALEELLGSSLEALLRQTQ